MKTRIRRPMKLQDLIRAVSAFAQNDREVSLVVADLINRRVVKLLGEYRDFRIEVGR
jgi:hypothetical protein